MTVLPDTHDEGKLRSENAVLRSALETADARLAQAQTELEAASVQVKALQQQVKALQVKAAKWDSVPVDAIGRYWNSDQYPQLEDDSRRIRAFLDSLDGDA